MKILNEIPVKTTNSFNINNLKIDLEVPTNLEYKSFINALQQIGFDEEQIAYLSEDYLIIEKCMNMYIRLIIQAHGV